jgi:hypothetical protein
MNMKKQLFSFGAFAFLTMPFIALSCQTTGKNMREDKTMMESQMMAKKMDNDCQCAEEGKKCECGTNQCESSCGGEAQ